LIDPLTSVTINTHPLGNELQLAWVMPETLPDSYRLAIFKNITVITDLQISNYFSGVETDIPVTFIEPDSSGNIVDGIIDMNVENGKHYYYRLLIQDKDSELYSATVDADKVVTSTYTIVAIDCKELVIKAIKRILNTYSLIEWKDYELRRQWTPPADKNPTIYVVRAPNQVVQHYMGDMILNRGNEQIQGEIEQDNIEVIWEDPNHLRIDTLTNIFRYSKTIIKRYFEANDITEVEIVMGGDALNAAFHDRPEPSASMMIHCTFEVQEIYIDNKTEDGIGGQELRIEEQES